MKTKAFSKMGLGQAAKLDPKEKARNEMRDWINETVSQLGAEVRARGHRGACGIISVEMLICAWASALWQRCARGGTPPQTRPCLHAPHHPGSLSQPVRYVMGAPPHASLLYCHAAWLLRSWRKGLTCLGVTGCPLRAAVLATVLDAAWAPLRCSPGQLCF